MQPKICISETYLQQEDNRIDTITINTAGLKLSKNTQQKGIDPSLNVKVGN